MIIFILVHFIRILFIKNAMTELCSTNSFKYSAKFRLENYRRSNNGRVDNPCQHPLKSCKFPPVSNKIK